MAATVDGKFQPKLTQRERIALTADVASGMSKAAAGRKYGVSTHTVFRILGGDQRYGKRKRRLKPCGTEAAYRRHLQAKERCVTCWTKHAEYERNRKKAAAALR